MRVLALDTALGACSVALLEDGIIAARRFEERTRGHAEALMGLLGDAEKEAGFRSLDCDRLAVTVGPGTFTGLRVGLAAAKGLALACERPLVGITTLRAIAANVEDPAARIAVLLDAKRGEVYAQDFESRTLAPLHAPKALTHEAAARFVEKGAAKPTLVVGSGASIILPLLAKGFADLSTAGDQPDAAKVAQLAEAVTDLEAHRAHPLYLRAPDAKLPSRNPLVA